MVTLTTFTRWVWMILYVIVWISIPAALLIFEHTAQLHIDYEEALNTEINDVCAYPNVFRGYFETMSESVAYDNIRYTLYLMTFFPIIFVSGTTYELFFGGGVEQFLNTHPTFKRVYGVIIMLSFVVFAMSGLLGYFVVSDDFCGPVVPSTYLVNSIVVTDGSSNWDTRYTWSSTNMLQDERDVIYSFVLAACIFASIPLVLISSMPIFEIASDDNVEINSESKNGFKYVAFHWDALIRRNLKWLTSHAITQIVLFSSLIALGVLTCELTTENTGSGTGSACNYDKNVLSLLDINSTSFLSTKSDFTCSVGENIITEEECQYVAHNLYNSHTYRANCPTGVTNCTCSLTPQGYIAWDANNYQQVCMVLASKLNNVGLCEQWESKYISQVLRNARVHKLANSVADITFTPRYANKNVEVVSSGCVSVMTQNDCQESYRVLMGEETTATTPPDGYPSGCYVDMVNGIPLLYYESPATNDVNYYDPMQGLYGICTTLPLRTNLVINGSIIHCYNNVSASCPSVVANDRPAAFWTAVRTLGENEKLYHVPENSEPIISPVHLLQEHVNSCKASIEDTPYTIKRVTQIATALYCVASVSLFFILFHAFVSFMDRKKTFKWYNDGWLGMIFNLIYRLSYTTTIITFAMFLIFYGMKNKIAGCPQIHQQDTAIIQQIHGLFAVSYILFIIEGIMKTAPGAKVLSAEKMKIRRRRPRMRRSGV